MGASCRILRCNSEFVAATVHLSGGGGAALSSDSAYCGALRSYSLCTKRTARPCRGDLAYHSAVQGIEDLLIQHRCPRAGPTARPWPRPQGAVLGDACLYERSFVSREGRAPEYRHCSVFGDPHIRTFGDDFHTCAVQGAWPLIDNDYLYVQVTGAPASQGTHHTVVTKVGQSSADSLVFLRLCCQMISCHCVHGGFCSGSGSIILCLYSYTVKSHFGDKYLAF